MPEMIPIAIVCSDLHFSHTPPIARSGEPDWYEAQSRAWNQVQNYATTHNLPVLIAGDIFDKWNPPPELINFVIDLFYNTPWIYAVPGQHDMPNHNHKELYRSAYGSLIRAGVITNLQPQAPYRHDNLHIVGFPWGFDLQPNTNKVKNKDARHVARVHRYVWHGKSKYPDAPKEQHCGPAIKELAGFDFAVFGDNHKGFLAPPVNGPRLVNCGGFMRRKSDEIEYNPFFAILYSDGSVVPKKLNTAEDIISNDHIEQDVEHGTDFSKFLKALSQLTLHDKQLDIWFQTVTANSTVSAQVKRIIKLAIEESKQ